MLKRAIALVILAGLVVTCSEAYAATVTLTWTNPATNTNGSPLTNLSDILFTWGPCSADHSYIDQTRGTLGEAAVVTSAAGAAMTDTVTIAGKGDTCFVAVAQNTIGQMSEQTAVAVWKVPLPTLGQPVQLSEVIHLSFKHAS